MASLFSNQFMEQQFSNCQNKTLPFQVSLKTQPCGLQMLKTSESASFVCKILSKIEFTSFMITHCFMKSVLLAVTKTHQLLHYPLTVCFSQLPFSFRLLSSWTSSVYWRTF